MSTETNIRYCQNCKFAEWFDNEGHSAYLCLISPPILVVGSEWGQWPKVHPGDHCSKFEPSEERTPLTPYGYED